MQPYQPPQVVVAINPFAVPPQKSVAAAVWLTIFFGPLGMFAVSAKAGWLSLLICVVAAVFTLGLSILVQIVALPIIAMSMVQLAAMGVQPC
jgi:hypothetical protein